LRHLALRNLESPAMSRRPRLDLPGVPVHLVQRGNNRQPCFFDDADRKDFLAVLADRAQAFEVAVHSYALMDNHFHLLAHRLVGKKRL
jgi:putative transposase